MNYWKWSNGDEYYKSIRKQKQPTNSDEFNYNNTSKNAIKQSLYQEDLIDTIDTNIITNKREELDDKLSSRELIFQRGTNPFLQTNYIDDVINHDTFLKPVNTTLDKIKEDNN
jgi:hypothetical protein